MAGYWEREGGEAMKNRGRDPCGGSWCTAHDEDFPTEGDLLGLMANPYNQ